MINIKPHKCKRIKKEMKLKRNSNIYYSGMREMLCKEKHQENQISRFPK